MGSLILRIVQYFTCIVRKGCFAESMCVIPWNRRAAVKIYCRVHPEKACYVHIGNVLIFLKTKVLLLNNVLTTSKNTKFDKYISIRYVLFIIDKFWEHIIWSLCCLWFQRCLDAKKKMCQEFRINLIKNQRTKCLLYFCSHSTSSK